MKKRLMLSLGALGLIAIAGVSYYGVTHVTTTPTVVTTLVTRGDVLETVDATGTLQAVTTVQVGTQASGTIKALHADFNSRVRKGQVVAELEPSLFQAQVEQARASVVRLEAEALRVTLQREDAWHKVQRARELSAKQLIPATDLETAEMNVRQADAAIKSAEAQIAQARASLNQSEVNLAHTVISAPIDGIVISRNVDVGQTVAASMQAPTLFVIARDLTAMQVNASVAESDIGRIQAGQPVSFRVDAYPGEVFSGRVSQVRLEPVVQQNVVSYVTTIDVPNKGMKLKPGMTANVTIETARAADVLRVPNAALRLRLSADLLAALGQPSDDSGAGHPVTARHGGPGGAGGHTAEPPAGSRPGEVWISAAGRLEKVPVRVGISDGSHTAVLGGRLAEGDQVVSSVATTSTSPSQTSSPLLPFGTRVPGGGRGAGANRPPGR